MPEFRPEELSQWVSRSWKNGMPDGVLTGVSHDTRTLRPGDLYVVIRGENFDGHAFVGDAFAKGAVGALVEEDFEWTENPVLKVPDTIPGLQDLARGYRKTWSGTPVGITGSVGKTTVKEMCADILSVRGETHRTAGNYNNHIGLPLTMLAMPPTARYGVFEIGMNRPGEISALSDLLQPEVGVITDICNAHRESFGSLEEIACEKAQLAEYVSGFVVVDCDSEWYSLIRANAAGKVVTVSLGGSADYAGRQVDDGVLEVNGFAYSMPLPGEHIMRNALRAIALGLELGITPAEVAEGLSRFKGQAMRWQESEIDGVQFINDAYNANPLSMQANLRTFAGMGGDAKKWAVIGGMRELGAISADEHAALGRFIDELALDGVITVGELGRGIVCQKTARFFQCDEAGAAAHILKEHLRTGDRVLLKASRGERLEQVLDHFKEI